MKKKRNYGLLLGAAGLATYLLLRPKEAEAAEVTIVSIHLNTYYHEPVDVTATCPSPPILVYNTEPIQAVVRWRNTGPVTGTSRFQIRLNELAAPWMVSTAGAGEEVEVTLTTAVPESWPQEAVDASICVDAETNVVWSCPRAFGVIAPPTPADIHIGRVST